MKYPFVGGQHDGQVLELGDEPAESVVLPYTRPPGDIADAWTMSDAVYLQEIYRRERFSMYVRTDGLVERCTWVVYLCGDVGGSLDDAPMPWPVVLSRAPDERVPFEAIYRADVMEPPAMRALDLMMMGASWL